MNKPVTPSSATTRLPAGKYITPFTTIGVTSFIVPAAGLFAPGRSRYAQACASLDMLLELICFNGE